MTTIKTDCDNCGQVHLRVEDVTLHPTGTYVFHCPSCRGVFRRAATSRVKTVLQSVGVADQITEFEIERFVRDLGRL